MRGWGAPTYNPEPFRDFRVLQTLEVRQPYYLALFRGEPLEGCVHRFVHMPPGGGGLVDFFRAHLVSRQLAVRIRARQLLAPAAAPAQPVDGAVACDSEQPGQQRVVLVASAPTTPTRWRRPQDHLLRLVLVAQPLEVVRPSNQAAASMSSTAPAHRAPSAGAGGWQVRAGASPLDH
jgi:hypothetical protein